MYKKSAKYLKDSGVNAPEYGLILGSGLGDLADEVANPIEITYDAIPNFPVSTVEGHEGKLIYGDLGGKKVVVLKGRFHYYEGYDLQAVTFPIRVFKELGVDKLIITNAAGAVNASFSPGDLMIIKDHINLTGMNPLIGQNVGRHGPRFLDMSTTYSERGQKLLCKIGKELKLNLQKGVYTWFTGPSYETPAEIKMVQLLGGDAVGMSTVPEAIVGKHTGMEVVGISCITNMAAGLQTHLNHEEVVKVSNSIKPQFKELIIKFIEEE